MDQQLHQIGHFQFENLIQNRIPFLLVHFGQDLKGIFQPHHLSLSLARQMNVQNHFKPQNWLSRTVLKKKFAKKDLDTFFNQLKNEVADQNQAIVLLCETGDKSEALLKELLKKNYINTFFVEGGLQRLKADIPAIPSKSH